MIYVITGKPGHGKTAYATRWIRNVLKQGETVYSNTKLNPEKMFSDRKFEKIFGFKKSDVERKVEGDIISPHDRETCKILYWQNFSDWQFFKTGFVLVDEGLRYFNARKWESLTDRMQARLTEHRKDGIDMIITVQDFSFIDKTVRVLCEKFINCKLIMGSPRFEKTFLPRISKITDIDLPTINRCENMGIDPYEATQEEAEKMHLKISTDRFWIKSKIFTWYDTTAKMVDSRPENLVHKEVKCLDCGFVRTSHA